MVLNGMKMFSLSGGESNKLFQNKMLGKFYQLIEFSFLYIRKVRLKGYKTKMILM